MAGPWTYEKIVNVGGISSSASVKIVVTQSTWGANANNSTFRTEIFVRRFTNSVTSISYKYIPAGLTTAHWESGTHTFSTTNDYESADYYVATVNHEPNGTLGTQYATLSTPLPSNYTLSCTSPATINRASYLYGIGSPQYIKQSYNYNSYLTQRCTLPGVTHEITFTCPGNSNVNNQGVSGTTPDFALGNNAQLSGSVVLITYLNNVEIGRDYSYRNWTVKKTGLNVTDTSPVLGASVSGITQTSNYSGSANTVTTSLFAVSEDTEIALSGTYPAAAYPSAFVSTSSDYKAGSIRLYTYCNGVQIGNDAKSVNWTLPTYSITGTLSSSRTGQSVVAKYVKSLNSITLSVNGSASQYGATISSYRFAFGSQTSSEGSATSDTFVCDTAGIIQASVVIKDSRGRTDTLSSNITVYDYSAPTVQFISIGRDTPADEAITISGSGSASQTAYAANSVSLNIKLAGVSIASGTNTVSYTGTQSVSTANTFTLEGTDAFGAIVSITGVIDKAEIYISAGGGTNETGVAIGGPSTDDSLQIYLPIEMSGATLADFPIEVNSDSIWNFAKMNSGISMCWGFVPATNPAGSGATTWTTNGYSTNYVECRTFAWPEGLFISRPTIIATNSDSGSGVGFAEDDGSTATNCKISLGGKNTAITAGAHVFAIGRWK